MLLISHMPIGPREQPSALDIFSHITLFTPRSELRRTIRVARVAEELGLSLMLRYMSLLLTVPVALVLLVRFFKRPIAGFHRAITNRIACRFAGRLPGFALVKNVGRKSGKLYRTPVNVFRQKDGFLIALTYGRESGWVAVLASGTCELETRGVSYRLANPVLVHDRSRRRFPAFVRVVLSLIDANEYLQLQFLSVKAEGTTSAQGEGFTRSSI